MALFVSTEGTFATRTRFFRLLITPICRAFRWVCWPWCRSRVFHDWCAFMDSRLRGNDGERFARMAGTHDCVVIDLSLSFPSRRESIKAHQSWNTRDLHHGQQTQRNALHIGVINNLKQWVRVARVPSVDTNRALISSMILPVYVFW